MYRRPFDSTWAVRRSVSEKWVLPPSMITSPGESSGSNCSMKSSTAGPAFTMSITLRGVLRLATSSFKEWQPTKRFPFPRPLTKSSTLPTVRLNTATRNPRLSMFNTRFSPITARPINPMSHCSDMVDPVLVDYPGRKTRILLPGKGGDNESACFLPPPDGLYSQEALEPIRKQHFDAASVSMVAPACL